MLLSYSFQYRSMLIRSDKTKIRQNFMVFLIQSSFFPGFGLKLDNGWKMTREKDSTLLFSVLSCSKCSLICKGPEVNVLKDH